MRALLRSSHPRQRLRADDASEPPAARTLDRLWIAYAAGCAAVVALLLVQSGEPAPAAAKLQARLAEDATASVAAIEPRPTVRVIYASPYAGAPATLAIVPRP